MKKMTSKFDCWMSFLHEHAVNRKYVEHSMCLAAIFFLGFFNLFLLFCKGELYFTILLWKYCSHAVVLD